MATSMYELALQLEQKLNKISSKKGHVVFRTLKGETKFVFQFEKKYKEGIIIHLFKTEEDLAFSVVYDKKISMEPINHQLMLDSSIFLKGIRISFTDKSFVEKKEIRRMKRAGLDVENLEKLPYLWNGFKEKPGTIYLVSNQDRKFVEQVLPIISQEETIEKLDIIWNKNQKYYYQKVPTFEFNQRTKEANYVTHEPMISLKDSEKYQYFASNSPAPLFISELEYAACMQQIETIVNISMQLRIGVQMMAASDLIVNNPPFMLEIADKDTIVQTILLDSLDPKLIQKEFLEIFEEIRFIPETILTSGILGTYLRNALVPLANKLQIKLKQVDSLPTFNRMTFDDYVPIYLELYGFDVSQLDGELNNRLLED